MQPTHPNYASFTSNPNTNSAYHRKNRKQLLDFLHTSFGFSHALSNLVLTVHECSDMSQLMSLFVLDDENYYGHVYVPDREDAASARCRICEAGRSQHTHQVTWEEVCGFEGEVYNQQLMTGEDESKIYSKSFTNQNYYYQDSLLQEKKPQWLWNPKKLKESQYKSCVICYGGYSTDQMVYIDGVLHQICTNCMTQYLKQQILNLRIQKIKCPHCQKILTPAVIKQYISNTLFQKYQTFTHNLQIQKDPNFKWCPNPKCSVVISINKKKGTIKCPKCQTLVCTKCNREAHPKLSCDEVMNNIFKGLQNAIDIQKCKKCKAPVEKIAGCNHMTCGVCRYQWCWLCGSTYSDYHFSPLNPLGCAGMQNSNFSGFRKCRIYILRVLMIIGILILLPIVTPLVMVFCGPVFFHHMMTKRVCRYYGCCFQFFIIILSLPIGLILDPFIWIFAVGYSIPMLYNVVKNWRQRRRNIIQGSQNQIKRRLLEQGQAVVVSQN